MQANKIIYPGGEILLRDTLIYVTIDPSGGADEATATSKVDKMGWCVNAVPVSGQWFILELDRKYLSAEQMVEQMFSLDTKYHPYMFGMEKSPILESYMRLQFRQRNKVLKVFPLEHKRRAKEDRIVAIRPLLKDIYFLDSKAASIQQHLRSWYTEQEHEDDDLDAFAYQIDMARPPTKKQLEMQQAARSRIDEQEAMARLSPNEQAEWKKFQELFAQKGNARVWSEELEDFYNGDGATPEDHGRNVSGSDRDYDQGFASP